ncbi:YdbH domain-containing protein [Halopseudomonas sp.]|uniref:YdbH domain-containing protein n=1 Tax=Halopseudomonas sp. TaxID=2901191 RepID=UPI0030037A56
MRKALGVVITVLVLASLGLGVSVWWAQRALSAAGVQQLEWQGVGWQQGGLELAGLSFVLPSGSVALEQLRLVPGWRDGPRLRVLEVGHAVLRLDATERESEDAGMQAASLTAPELWQNIVDWLPDQVSIAQLSAALPCRSGTCELAGSLQASRTAADPETDTPVVAQAELALQAAQQRFLLKQTVQANSNRLSLHSQLLIDDQPAAELSSDWQGLTQWQGRLSVPGWPETRGLYEYLGSWFSLGTLPVASLPPGAQLSLDWDLAAAQPPVQWADWLGGEAAFNAQIALPQPWAVAQLGNLAGELQLALRGQQGRWQLLQGNARLLLTEPQLAALAVLPGDLQLQQIQLQITPAASTALGKGDALPFGAELRVQGANGLSGRLKGDLSLRLAQDWELQLVDTQLGLQLASWREPGIVLRDLQLTTPLRGQLDSQGATLQASKGGQLAWSRLQIDAAELALGSTNLKLQDLTYQQQWQDAASLQAGSRLEGTIAAVTQPQLQTQRWTLGGRWSYAEGALQWAGKLGNSADLALDTRFSLPAAQPWQATVNLPPLFFRAGNPLAQTLASWPALLSLSSGQLRGEVQVTGGDQLALTGDLNLAGIKGIYDRSAFSGLSAPLKLGLRNNVLQLGSSDLQLDSVNPGLAMGPLRAAASYQASLDQVTQGRLQLDRAQLQLLGGQISAEPVTLDFAAAEQRMTLELSGLELDTLFEVYPTEGLSGRGTLDGRLPVVLRDGELMVDEGAVAAREPGGVLRYQSDKLQRLAQSNSGMRELAGALENFHYTVLSSQVNYAEDGTLQLGLRLQGNNPNFQQGRQVNLNVNLQENIPALLTSLQLSSQVSDIIQQRVQQRLLEQRLQPNKE